jgi:FtsZ-binding cell division protein ZapB
MSENKSSTTVYILSGTILIQFGIIAYLLFHKNDQKEIIVQNTETIQKDSLEISAKMTEFKIVGEDLKKLKEEMLAMGINKDSMGAEMDAVLESLWEVEMGGAITLADLNAKVSQAKKLLVLKDLQIKNLKEKSDSLSFEAKVLKSETEAKTQRVRDMLEDTKQLSEKVSIAARVKAENIIITGFSRKDKVINKEIVKAKELSKLKINFNLADNKVTKKNTKISLMFRLIKANSVVIFSETNGGGYFQSSDNGELPYTGKQEIEFDNTNQEISFVYKNEPEYHPGIYKIELYADGYSIGESHFKLK